MQELISIIIPVYNAEKYIVPCLESLLAQTYSCWEAILVNDGSVDGSSQILADYAKKDSRFQVISQENQGVSAARNAGLSRAQGVYVAFIDADDYIKPDYLAVLAGDAISNDADIVCCNFIEILNGKTVQLNTPKVLNARLITDRIELFRDFISNQEAYGTCVWAKLIRTSLAKKEAFKPLKFGEDSEFMLRLFIHAPKVYLTMYAGYFYIRNEDSATMQHDEKSVLRRMYELHMTELMLQILPEEYTDVFPLYLNRYATAIHALAGATVFAEDSILYKQYRKELLQRIRDLWASPTPVTGKTKVYLQLYRHTPWLYKSLLRIKHNCAGITRRKVQ